jgi:sugar phosphate isomerase/epimerase
MRAWKYAICNEGFEGWSLEKVAQSVAEMGYEGVELAPFTLCDLVTDLTADDRRGIRQAVEGAGQQVAGVHWLLAKTPFLLNVPDAEMRKSAADYLVALVDFCADVGGDALVFGSPAQRDPQDGFSVEDAWGETVEAMRRVGKRANERGVQFCIEPLGTPFVTWADDAVTMVKEVNQPGFSMMVDCKAMAQDARWSPADQIRELVGQYQHVHVNDPNRLGPGMGDLDFQPIMQALDEVAFGGWVSVEAFEFSQGPEFVARESLRNLREAERTN